MNIAEFSNFSENGEDFFKLVLLALENTYKASDKATRSVAENDLRENQKKIVYNTHKYIEQEEYYIKVYRESMVGGNRYEVFMNSLSSL